MEPTAHLDQRFSQGDAVATPWSETLAIIESAELYFLSTVRHDGRAHVTPLVGQWLDGALHFSVGDKEQKFMNLQVHPYVVMTTGTDAWDKGIDVVVEGRAERVSDHEELARLAAAWTARWDGRWQYQVRDGNFAHPRDEDEASSDEGAEVVAVFRVEPTRAFAFSKGPYSHTTYRF